MNQLTAQLTAEQQKVLDSVLDQALKNVEDFEGIKSGIVRRGAFSLFHSGVEKKMIARLLISALCLQGMSKKTQISKDLVYHVLRADEFKALKSESHAKRGRGKGRKQKSLGLTVKPNDIPALTCEQVLEIEVKKIREREPSMSNKQIKQLLKKLDIVNQFTPSTLRNAFAHVLPVNNLEATPVVAVPPAGLSQEVIDQQQQEADLIKVMEIMEQIIKWLSGMTEGQRAQFYKTIPNGQSHTLALQERCKDHITWMVKKMPEDFVRSFLQYTDEITHLVKVWDEKLYEEKLLREQKRDMSSR